jgi:[protein-PII] uridylyltransferase
MNEDDAAQWELLVREHLLMSHLAQHRDTQDPGLIVEFARTIRSVENLKLLYVMTFADMRAVGPQVWNNWRDMLLGELYMRTLTLLEQGQLVLEEQGKRAARIAQRLLAAVDAARRPSFEAFLCSMPERYLTTTPEAQIPTHFELMNHLREEWSVKPAHEQRHLFVGSVRHVPEREYSEFTICTPDRPGLFAMITGVLTAQGMNIVGARIATSRDGVAVDSFRVEHLERREMVLEPDRWERVNHLLAKVLRGQLDVESMVAESRRPSILERKTGPEATAEVIADNAISQDYTVLDVLTQDRVGVLFTITHCLHRLGIVIHLAKITTQAHQVLDVFYVTDVASEKITDPARLRVLREAIVDQLRQLREPCLPAGVV